MESVDEENEAEDESVHQLQVQKCPRCGVQKVVGALERDYTDDLHQIFGHLKLFNWINVSTFQSGNFSNQDLWNFHVLFKKSSSVCTKAAWKTSQLIKLF